MSFQPPYKLDPYVAVRNPAGIPVLLQRGIHDVIKREEKDGGSLHDRFVKAFNVVVFALTEAKKPRLRRATLELTPEGIVRENQVVRLTDTREKQRWLLKWAERLKVTFPGRYDNSWWTDPMRGINPTQVP